MFGLNASATSSQHNISGDFQVGGNIESYSLDADKAMSMKANCPAGGAFMFNPTIGNASPIGTWADDVAYQTLQLVGSGWGDAIITDATQINFGDISVPVTTGQTPEVWGQAVCDAVNATLTGSGYRLRMNGTEMIFEPDPNSATPGIVDVDDLFVVTGPTAGFGNKNSTLATRPSQFGILEGEGNDFDGNPLAPITPAAMLIKTAPACSIMLLDTGGLLTIPANGMLLFKELPNDTQWEFTPATAGVIQITLIG